MGVRTRESRGDLVGYALGTVTNEGDGYIAVERHLIEYIGDAWFGRDDIPGAAEGVAEADQVMYRQTIVAKTCGNIQPVELQADARSYHVLIRNAHDIAAVGDG